LAELSVGMTTEGIDVRSVGNTLTLHETALIEAFNLKAAIEYQLKNCKWPQYLWQLIFIFSNLSTIIHINISLCPFWKAMLVCIPL